MTRTSPFTIDSTGSFFRPASNAFHANLRRMLGECTQIFYIAGQNGSSRFRERDYHCVDGRASSSLAPKLSCPASDSFGYLLHNVAGFQERIGIRVSARVTL